jgi:hypothetical protein
MTISADTFEIAGLDAQSLADVVNGPESGLGSIVTTRTGRTIETLAHAISGMSARVGDIGLALGNASEALSKAQLAHQAAIDAAEQAALAQDELGAIAADGILVPLEKRIVIRDYNTLIGEQTRLLIQGNSYNLTIQTANYQTAIADLTSYLATLTSPTNWDSTLGRTIIVASTFEARFAAVYDTRQILLTAIYEKAKILADLAINNAALAYALGLNAVNLAGLAQQAAEDAALLAEEADHKATQAGIDIQALGNLTAAKAGTYFQPDAPSEIGRVTGDLWFDTDDNYKLYRFDATQPDGSKWVLATGTSASGGNSTFYTATAPSEEGRITGDLWFDVDNNNRLYRFDALQAPGSRWVDVTTTVSGLSTFYQDSAPSETGRLTGDLWFDTNDNYRVYRFDSTQASGSRWVNATSTATSGSKTFYAADITARDALTGLATGDLCFVASENSRCYRYESGTGWISVTPAVTPGVGVTTGITAPSTPKNGDIWCDTTGGSNLFKVWNGTGWITQNENKITTGITAPSNPTGGDIWNDTSVSPTVIRAWNGTGWINLIAAGTVTAGHLAAHTITAEQIASDYIYTNTLTAAQVNVDGLDAAHITVGVLDAARLNAASITAGLIDAGKIVTGSLGALVAYIGSITASQITAGYIHADRLHADSFTAGTIDASKLTTGTLGAQVGYIGTLAAEQITTGYLGADRIAADTITGEKLVARSITTRELVLTDFTNLCLDPNGELHDTSTYAVSSSTAATAVDAQTLVDNSLPTGSWAIAQSVRDNYLGEWFSVKPGDEFWIDYVGYTRDCPNPIQVGFIFHDEKVADNSCIWSGISGSPSITGKQLLTGRLVVPLGVTYARIWTQINASGGFGTAYFRNILVRRRIGASLIVDGSITASKIVAGSITAKQLTLVNFDNLWPNANSEDLPPSEYTPTSEEPQWSARYKADAASFSGNWVRSIWMSRSAGNVYIQSDFPELKIPCSPGEIYYFAAQIYRLDTNGTGNLTIRFKDKDNSVINNGTVSYEILALTEAGWNLRQLHATAPSGAVTAHFTLEIQSVLLSARASFYADALYVRRMMDGNLLVEGSIGTYQLDFYPVTSSSTGPLEGKVIASIKASTEGMRITGDKISIDGNTEFTNDSVDPRTKESVQASIDRAAAAVLVAQQLASQTVKPTSFYDFTTATLPAGWVSSNNAIATIDNTYTRFTAFTTDPILTLQGLSLSPASNHIVAARLKLVSGAWQGTCYFANAGHTFTETNQKTVAAPPIGEWVTVVWDMRSLTSGTDYISGGTIQGLRLDLCNSMLAVIYVDWIAVGVFGTISDGDLQVIAGKSLDKATYLSAGKTTINGGMITTDTIKTTGYQEANSAYVAAHPEYAVGDPIFGAKLATEGDAIKVAANNLKIGAYTIRDSFFRSINALWGTSVEGGGTNRVWYKGNIDLSSAARNGAPNIYNLSIARRRWDSSRKMFSGYLVLMVNAVSDNYEAMRYAALTLYQQSAAGIGAQAALQWQESAFVTLPDRKFVDPYTDNSGNNHVIADFTIFCPYVTGGYPALTVTLHNAFGQSAMGCYYTQLIWSQLTSSYRPADDYETMATDGTSFPGSWNNSPPAPDPGGGSGAIGGGNCPAPWVPISVGVPHVSPLHYDKPAGDIKVGDFVWTWRELSDGLTQDGGTFNRVSAVSNETNVASRLTLVDGRILEMSSNHRVFSDGGWVEVQNLIPGARIDGDRPGVVASVQSVGEIPVVRITVETASTYQTNGLLSHNAKRVDTGDLP